jgi:hypothetical protein
MANLTLVEALKMGGYNQLRAGVIATFIANNPLLQFLPFKDIDGNAYQWNEEETLPGVGFRNVNEEYTADYGVVNPRSETLKIGGGLVKIDRSLTSMQSGKATSILSEQIAMKVKAMSLKFQKTFIKGDEDSDPSEFYGIEKRVGDSQIVEAGSGAATLTLAKLDELIDACDPDALLMNKTLRRKVSSLVRAAGQAQETVNGAFGTRLNAYASIPIIPVDYDNEGSQILPFTEKDATGDSSACSSIYGCKFGPDALTGIQNGIIDVEDQGTQNIFRQILVEWYVSIIAVGPRCIARLRGITNT